MSSNKEADLTTAVLLYAMRCLAEGDQQALRAMNFGPKELDALKEMNLADLYRAAHSAVPLIPKRIQSRGRTGTRNIWSILIVDRHRIR